MMKRLLIVTVSIIALTGCGTTHSIVKEVSHDTLYLNKVQFDSIYVDNWHQIDRSKDTVLIREILREYKYQLLKDTVRVVQVDSIPVIREVEVTKTVKTVPGIYKWSLAICIILLILLIIYIVWKIKF